MQTNKKDIEALWLLYVENRATSEELNELFASLQDVNIETAHATWALQAAMNSGARLTADSEQEEAIWQQLLLEAEGLKESQVFIPSNSNYQVRFLHRWGWVAASIILVLGLGAYLWIDNKKNNTVAELVARQHLIEEIPSGKDGAILTLADGSQIVLDSLGNGLVTAQSGSETLIQNGSLVYKVTGASEGDQYHTMTTPNGRQFNLSLPDGSRVWLNAASSIRYPTVFTGKERRVELIGEAYFEVAKNTKMPFRVSVNNEAEVEVLGTHFNVHAYEDEASVNTTLIEGSIAVATTSKLQSKSAVRQPVLLKPGQQAQVLVGQKEQQPVKVVTGVDINKVMAWKNGVIYFDGVTLEDIMRQLERWYDIEVVYEDNKVPAKRLAGKMTRDVPLNGLLKNLEKMGVHYKLNNRTLIISP